MARGSLPSDVLGASRLAIDLTLFVTTLVEAVHRTVVRQPPLVGRVSDNAVGGVTGLVYGSVRGVTRLVGTGIEAALAPLATLLDRATPWSGRDALVAGLNGVLGDYLEATANPLAIPMRLRVGENPLDLSPRAIRAAVAKPRERVIVMVHGLCLTDTQWNREGHDHGRALADDWLASALYLRYNSGRAIATSGDELSALLENLIAQWPVPLNELVLVGHSMGGLVMRAACAAASRVSHTWPKRLRALVFIGTPHHGAPLERAGHGVDLLLAASPYTAPFSALGRLRSQGIRDLRHGSVRDPLPHGIACFAIAGSASKSAPRRGGIARGDGLVPIASALGLHADPRRTLDLPPAHRHVVYETRHLELLSSEAVYCQVRRWLTRPPRVAAAM